MLKHGMKLLAAMAFLLVSSATAHAITYNVGSTDPRDSAHWELQFLNHITTANEIVTVDPSFYQQRTSRFKWVEFWDTEVPTAQLVFYGADDFTKVNTVNILQSGVPYPLKGQANVKVFINTYGTITVPVTLNASVRFFEVATQNMSIQNDSSSPTTIDVLAMIANKLELMSPANAATINMYMVSRNTVLNITPDAVGNVKQLRLWSAVQGGWLPHNSTQLDMSNAERIPSESTYILSHIVTSFRFITERTADTTLNVITVYSTSSN